MNVHNKYLNELNILVIDDQDDIRESLEALIGMWAKNAYSASDGKEGLEVYKKYSPDIIVTDIKMPVMSGLEMIRSIKKEDPEFPVVITTAFQGTEYLLDAIELKVDGYIVKPIEKKELKKRLEAIGKSILLKKEINKKVNAEKEIDKLNENLQQEVYTQLKALREKDELLIEQSKLAQMGEMLNMIAHQWRQPLNAMSAAAINLSMRNELDLLDKESVEETSKFIQNETQIMSKIINNFMDFNKPEKNTEFSLYKSISVVDEMISSQLKSRDITLEIDVDKETKVFHNSKSIEHVLLNLILNSRDAFEDKKTKDKRIKIFTTTDEDSISLHIDDNAGGIPKEIINKIFNPYFTTKEQGKGTGVALYLSKQMVESVNGTTIDVEVINEHTLFKIKFHELSLK